MAPASSCRSSAYAILLLVLSCSALRRSDACALAVASCEPQKCAALANLPTGVSGVAAQLSAPYFQGNPINAGPPELGFYQGIANTNPKTWVNSSRGGAYINWEVFPYINSSIEAGYLLSSHYTPSLPDCCNLCAQTSGCSIYQFFSSNSLSEIYGANKVKGRVSQTNMSPLLWPTGHVDGMNCYLLTGGSTDESARYGFPEGWAITSPWAPTHTNQVSKYANIAPSWVGGHCNPTSVSGDPHFVGARGTKFEFNGSINKTFALISDEKLHLNMRLEGYEDSRTEEAPLVKNGKAIRTWIRELGFVWVHGNDNKHTLELKCRKGSEQNISKGYLSSILLDGKEVPVPALTDRTAQNLTNVGFLQRLNVEKKGYFDVETFQLALSDFLLLKLDLRPAHPLLQTKEEAYVHFSIFLEKFHPTGRVHGVLGQTFRQTSAQFSRALEYKLLGQLLRKTISADSDTGKGFLDGAPDDYVVQGLLHTDYKFSTLVV